MLPAFHHLHLLRIRFSNLFNFTYFVFLQKEIIWSSKVKMRGETIAFSKDSGRAHFRVSEMRP